MENKYKSLQVKSDCVVKDVSGAFGIGSILRTHCPVCVLRCVVLYFSLAAVTLPSNNPATLLG